MRVVIIYRPNSDHGRLTEDFVRDFKNRYPETRVQMENIDSRDGAATASLYYVTNYPAVIALREDGSPNMVWQGEYLPLLDEVGSYVL